MNKSVETAMQLSQEGQKIFELLLDSNVNHGVSTTNNTIMQWIYLTGIVVMFIFLFLLSNFIRKIILEKLNEITNLIRQPIVEAFKHYAELSVKYTTECINREINKKINQNNITRNCEAICNEIEALIDNETENGRDRLRDRFPKWLIEGLFKETDIMKESAKNNMKIAFKKAKQELEKIEEKEYKLQGEFNENNFNIFQFMTEYKQIDNEKGNVYDSLRREVFNIFFTINTKVSESLNS